MTPTEALERAILLAVDRGQRLPCDSEQGNAWVSDDHEERRIAAQLCGSCPCSSPAAPPARREVHGVWGGRDVSPSGRTRHGSHRPGTRRQP